jgi:cellulose synthase (UDP-forming)
MKKRRVKSAFKCLVRGENQAPPQFRPRTELDLTGVSILLTLVITVLAIYQLVGVYLGSFDSSPWMVRVTQPLLWLIIIFYVYGGLVYQITRVGYLRRGIRHHPASWDQLDHFRQGDMPTLTVLVPSYKEEDRVVFNTLMSVALQDYANKRVVLLIDDPPDPKTKADTHKLRAARRLPGRVTALLSQPKRRFEAELDAFIQRSQGRKFNHRRETARLASLYAEAANWFASQAQAHPRIDHADALYVDQVLKWHERRHRDRARQWAVLMADTYLALTFEELLTGYQHLVALFSVVVTCFERKRYQNLSHESNKAMNLNSYIGLVGRAFQEQRVGEKLHLVEVSPWAADFSVPDANYFITLDADSLVSPDYALRLIHFMEQPANQRVAVAQTPYNSIPNAPTAIERIAGATTDIQYIIHQGFTKFNATYWVGANALLRKAALDDIAVEDTERGFAITRYIQDRTVIEDTESSIDMAARGWQLYNYPERLSFSATPPDFGSLIIQRRRWANGGLIILPKIRHLLSGQRLSISLAAQFFMRVHYLISITAVNLGLLLWLFIPSANSLQTLWLPLSALPYFLLYTRDLRLLGYRRRDMLSVYALNLMLIPVNLSGVYKSIVQLITQRKIPFGRTPKVQNRTAASPGFILAEYGLFFNWLTWGLLDLFSGRWLNGLFGLMNAAFMLYAILRFIGLKESIEDLFPRWSRRRARRTAPVHSSSSQMVSDTMPLRVRSL